MNAVLPTDLVVTASLLVPAPATWAKPNGHGDAAETQCLRSSATPHVVDMGYRLQVGVFQPTQPKVASRTLLLQGFLHTSELFLGRRGLAVGFQDSHDEFSHTWMTLLHHLQRVCPACPMGCRLGPGCTAKSQPTLPQRKTRLLPCSAGGGDLQCSTETLPNTIVVCCCPQMDVRPGSRAERQKEPSRLCVGNHCQQNTVLCDFR